MSFKFRQTIIKLYFTDLNKETLKLVQPKNSLVQKLPSLNVVSIFFLIL